MNIRFSSTRLVAIAALAFAGAAAHAAGPGGCNPDEARNDPAACKRESGAAKVEAQRGNLTTPASHAADRNAADRCKNLSGSARGDCMARMGADSVPGGSGATPAGSSTSTSTTTSGSVNGGGIIRETVTTTVTPARP